MRWAYWLIIVYLFIYLFDLLILLSKNSLLAVLWFGNTDSLAKKIYQPIFYVYRLANCLTKLFYEFFYP